MFKKKKNSFDIINNYLTKKGHDLIMSIYFENYNEYNIYIRFDYVKTVQAYKICWFDLNFIDYKHLDNYINIQTMTKNFGLKLDRVLGGINLQSDYLENLDILGDRVEILFQNKYGLNEYVFSRFLPKQWRQLADALVLTFAYLPRGMENILEELLGSLSDSEEYYNSLKPIKFNLFKTPLEEVFRKDVITRGEKYYEEGNVSFLEKINSKYIALGSGKQSYIVTIEEIDDSFTKMLCTCPCDYTCKHIYAVVKSIREKKFINFYKVKFIGKGESLLEKITNGAFSICCGVENDNLLIVTIDNEILKIPILFNGEKCFEIIEDDDELSLSKYLDKF